ncbi:MAG: transposase, partial [Rhodopila sp.]
DLFAAVRSVVGTAARRDAMRITLFAPFYRGNLSFCRVEQIQDMKEPWCLATSTTDKAARELINLYAKRWGIECGFRDSKDIRFGMGMGEVHVSTPDRRDRLWLINAFAVALLTHQATNPLAAPTGGHALPAHANHAGTSAMAPDRTVRRNAGRTAGLRRDVWYNLRMRGVLRQFTLFAIIRWADYPLVIALSRSASSRHR